MEEKFFQVSSFEKALEILNVAPTHLPPDPLAPNSYQFRLRPSEEAAILCQRYLNPPPPWGIKINLSRTFLGPEKCLEISRKLIVNKCVTYLDLSLCDLGEKASGKFFTYLEGNVTLRHLNVNGNAIKDFGAIGAAKCIKNLETLHVSSNEITDEGAIAIGDAVRLSANIKTLSIRNNKITLYGLFKIMDALEPVIDLMPLDFQNRLQNKKKNLSSHETPIPLDENEELSDEVLENSESVPRESSQENPGNVGTTIALTEEAEIFEEEEEVEEIPYNETLHTLWVDYNEPFPEHVLKSLNMILAKRFPQPPPGLIKKKKGKQKKK